jgi:Ni,Fe-hydrogenase III small subunit
VIDAVEMPGRLPAVREVCPTGAIGFLRRQAALDLGRCLFCAECERPARRGAIPTATTEHRLAATRGRARHWSSARRELPLARALDEKVRRLFGRSLKLRQVSAGGCNACEADVNVLERSVGPRPLRHPVRRLAAPRRRAARHRPGDAEHGARAAQDLGRGARAPKIVIAVGACAISGGPYIGHPEVATARTGAPVDLFIPGCPPHPLTILDGLLRLLGKLEDEGRVPARR